MKCPDCNGIGRIVHVDEDIDPYGSTETEGGVRFTECTRCGGDGEVANPPGPIPNPDLAGRELDASPPKLPPYKRPGPTGGELD